jgi:hypothetical protein
MKRLVMLLIMSEVMSVLPPMPQISSGGCGNSKAILFVRRIRYINVLKDYIEKKGAEIKDANFSIKISQIKINGLQSTIESMKKVIDGFSTLIKSKKENLKGLQSQYPDVNNLSGAAICNARYALSMIPPLRFALKEGHMDFDNDLVYTNASMQMGACLTSPSKVSLDEMLSESIQAGKITDKQITEYFGFSRKEFPDYTGVSYDEYVKDFIKPFDKSAVEDSLLQLERDISGLKPFLKQLSDTIAGIKGRIKEALSSMQKFGVSMTEERQKVLNNQSLIRNHIATIQAQKKIIEDCATEIKSSKEEIDNLVNAIKKAQSDEGMFKACPKWLQTALNGI